MKKLIFTTGNIILFPEIVFKAVFCKVDFNLRLFQNLKKLASTKEVFVQYIIDCVIVH